jgi:RNA polymerase sigma-70 factor (ECF subfamily)
MTASPSDFPHLLAAARNGCRESLGRVFQGCRRYVLGIARQEIPPDLLAKGSSSDVVQEAFLEAAHGFEHFHGDSEAQFRAWLRLLLRRRISKLLRRYRTTLKRRVGLEKHYEPDASRVEGRKVAADIPTPSAQVMQGEQAHALRLVLDRLPEDYRQVLRFRYEEQRSFEEIGTLMRRSGNAARLLWLRAVDRVKQELKLSDG